MGRTVAIIGGGFSGLLSAIHLLRAAPELTARLIERAPRFGRGRAYSTRNPGHLLNVRAANMSAFPTGRITLSTGWAPGRGRATGSSAAGSTATICRIS